MVTTAAILIWLLLAALAVFQLLLAMGAPLGRYAWGGQHHVLPMALRVGSVISIVIYAFVAASSGHAPTWSRSTSPTRLST